MEEWKEYKLIDVLEALIDYRGKTPKKVDSGIPLITAKIVKGGRINEPNEFLAEEDYDKWMVRGLPKPGDIVLTTEAPLGEVAQLDDRKIALAQRIVTLRGKKNVLDNTYLKYYFLSNVGQSRLKARETGTTVTGIKQSELREVLVTCPPFVTQQKIANILSSLDDKIEVNRRINEQLEELAGALFKSWFADFEPFKDGEFVDSELGMIPKGWKVGTLGEYCKVKSGFAFKSSWWQDNGLKVIKIKNITSDGVLDMNDCSYVSSENTLKAKDFKTNVGDLLIAMTGATIGKFCMISSKEEMYVNQRVGKFFLGDNPILKLPFIYCTLKTERVYSEIVNKGQGSAQPNISGSDIENIRIPLPEKVDYLLLFNEKLKSVFEKIIKNQQEITHLTTLRDTLLPKLMSGEIDVNEVKI